MDVTLSEVRRQIPGAGLDEIIVLFRSGVKHIDFARHVPKLSRGIEGTLKLMKFNLSR